MGPSIPAYQVLPGLRTVGPYARRYLEEIRYVDAQVGRLLEGLAMLGHRPAVLVTSDHGEAFGEDDYYFAHGHSLGIDQIRVPLIWRPAEPGEAAEPVHAVSILDVAPTLLEAAGLEVPASFEGRSLLGAAKDSSVPRALFAEQQQRVAIVAGRAYYARDRRPFDAPLHDRISGGEVHPMPTRAARLEASGEFPAYAPPDDIAASRSLEALVGRFLIGPPSPEKPQTTELSTTTIERLRALGYLE
jgi:arylsulfatase A-like enzyme